jgi:type IV secretion system protein VirD4
MEISVNVIIQNMAQLKAKYEKTFEVITGNCDSLLFLGGKETSTLKEVSESLGKETIDVEGKNRTKGKQSSTSESNSILGRELLLPSELSTMKIEQCVLMVRAFSPFLCKKFPIENHPNYKFLEDFDKKNKFDYSSIKAVTKVEYDEQNKNRKLEVVKEEIPEDVNKKVVKQRLFEETKTEKLPNGETILFNNQNAITMQSLIENSDYNAENSELEFANELEYVEQKELNFDDDTQDDTDKKLEEEFEEEIGEDTKLYESTVSKMDIEDTTELEELAYEEVKLEMNTQEITEYEKENPVFDIEDSKEKSDTEKIFEENLSELEEENDLTKLTVDSSNSNYQIVDEIEEDFEDFNFDTETA